MSPVQSTLSYAQQTAREHEQFKIGITLPNCPEVIGSARYTKADAERDAESLKSRYPDATIRMIPI